MKENWEDLFRVRYNGLPPVGGRVLVAEPFLRDGGFGRSVVYLTDHNEEGSVGFVLNKLFVFERIRRSKSGKE